MSRRWMRLDTDFLDHPKFADLTASQMVAWVRMLGYAVEHTTDGLVKGPILRASWRSSRALVAAGLLDEVDGKIYIHDFLEYQESADEVAAKSNKNSSNAKRGWETRRDATRIATGNANGNAQEQEQYKDKEKRPAGSARAREVLAIWNELLGARARSDEWLVMIDTRLAENPDLTNDQLRHRIEIDVKSPWWTSSPTPNMHFSAKQFERLFAPQPQAAPQQNGEAVRLPGEDFAAFSARREQVRNATKEAARGNR